MIKKLAVIAAAVIVAVSAQSLWAQADTIAIKLYFQNEKFNPNIQDCNLVFPVERRIPKTKAVATAALLELLKGPTAEEEAKQYSTFSGGETDGVLKSVNVKNGAAYVNFTSRMPVQMGNASTSCGSGFFSQVEKTLTQFPTIKKVYYAIEGNANDFYEWAQVGECPHGRHCSRSNFK